MSKIQLEQLGQYSTIDIKDKKYSHLLELQGQCKIINMIPIRIHYLKAFFLSILVIGSFFGILLLKYYNWFRVKIFFVECQITEATHVYIQGTGKNDDIQRLDKNSLGITFKFKKLKYEVVEGRAIPAGFKYWQNYKSYFNKNHYAKGLDEMVKNIHLEQFGRNQHTVDTPNYFQYLIEIMTKPFFLLQYLVCIIFILQKITIFAILMFIFSWATTTFNYILLFISYRKIKQIAEKQCPIRVIRNGTQVQIKNTDLVPGDIYFIQKNTQVICDSIIVRGEAYVNQSSLTGQSIPIGKFEVGQQSHLEQDNRWLFEGAKVLEERGNALAIVINTGYSTRRGRIIRKILNRVPNDPDFFMSAIYFLTETFIVGIILYLGTLPILFHAKITKLFRVFRFLDFLGWSFPPTFPIYFNLAYSFALARLRIKGINGTQPQKSVDGAELRIMCFDKTGTLTQNQIQVNCIFKFTSQSKHQIITKQLSEPSNALICQLFASCHTVKYINDQYLGDQVDLRMFLHTKSVLQVSEDPKIKFTSVSSLHQLEVLRINQFQSKFQNMSVLAKDKSTNRYYVFVKGAPQRIHEASIKKFSTYDKLVSGLSLGGFRTIGFGYKQIPSENVQQFLNCPREKFGQGIIALGVVGFQNKLKHDSYQTIMKLNQSEIQPKMITGDNIYIAVQTGRRAGIISKDERVIILQGKKQKFNGQQSSRKFKGIMLIYDKDQIQEEEIELTQNDSYLHQEVSIAIDNDFLCLKPEPYLPATIKLFSRINPQNKALVVKRFKEQLEKIHNQKSTTQKIFGNKREKVGMTGDGANDLMAIRQADLGIGISDSDASYGASFSIQNMLDIDQILREAKSTSSIIVQMLRYYGTVSFFKIPCAILMITQTTYFSANQLTYFNFTSTLWLPVALAMSRPCQQVTPLKPITNMLSLKNHLVYWGNIIIPVAGLCFGYFYYIRTDQFIPNPKPRLTLVGFFSLCQSTTVVFLLIQLPFALNAFFLHNSKPFKQKIYENWVLIAIIVGNFIADVIYFLVCNNGIKALNLVPISVKQGGILLVITVAFLIISYFYNWWIQLLDFEGKQLQKQRCKLNNSKKGMNQLNITQHLDD